MFLREKSDGFNKWLEGYHFNPILVSTILVFLLFWTTANFDPDALSAFLAMLVAVSPVWLPIYLAVIFWIGWIHYIRYMFWFSLDTMVLEVELPPEVEKSPLSMELFLISLFNTGQETTFLNRFWRGSFRPIWSLEIASNEGRIGFYIHGRSIWKNAVEARIYGQFPEAKVREVDDYVSKVPFNLTDYEIWCGEYKKGNIGALPIKTYVDFGLDKDTDTPETKVDPMTNIFELLNNMGKDEYLWFQIVMRGRGGDDWYGIKKKGDQFKEEGVGRIKKIMRDAATRASDLVSDDAEKKRVAARGSQLLTETEKEEVETIERSMGKQIYECGFRVLYLAKKERFFGYTGAHTYSFFRPFISRFNELRGTRGMVAFDYPWEDFMDIRKNFIKKQLYFFYKNRAYFNVPHDQEPVFMNTEELATIWRFPGSWVKTPGLNRVLSRRAEAPANLPTGE